MQGCTVLGKCGRVEYNEIVFTVGSVKELECVFAEGFMPVVSWKVERYVGVGQFYGFSTAVDGVYEVGSSPHCIYRETAGITEHVEHGAPLGITLEQAAVVALVDEESCLLSLEPVNVEL